MKTLRRAIVAVAVLNGAAIAAVFIQAIDNRNRVSHYTGTVVARSPELVTLCAAYRDHEANPERGKFPSTLPLLADPPPSMKSRFSGVPEAFLLDPERKPYRYAVVKTEAGEDEVYVWSEHVVKGKLKLVGAKRRADGQIEVFGNE